MVRAKLLARYIVPAAALALCTAVFAVDQDHYSRIAQSDLPRQVFWGDTHVHTNNSSDSYTLGNRILTPADAYRFARGDAVRTQTGELAKLRRPLDFLAVTDHAEYIGLFARVQAKDPEILKTDYGPRWSELIQTNQFQQLFQEFIAVLRGAQDADVPEVLADDIWNRVGAIADEYDDPGVFTTFVAYEWTSMPDSNNLHRNVLFREGSAYTSQTQPFSSRDSEDPQDLWRVLAEYEARTGGKVLAIPHNSNLSGGLMFPAQLANGDPLTAAYSEQRMRWEPIIEVTQMKGDSETHPILSPADEYADFETWESWRSLEITPKVTASDKPLLEGSYARAALRTGLEIAARIGVNPYKFGMIGSSDSHTALSTTEEDYFLGKFSMSPPSPTRWKDSWADGYPHGWRLGASGLAAVWARANTREALFAAMQRKEVYATTGSRIVLRLFGGWGFGPQDHLRPDYVDIGYEHGVPMGGDLNSAPPGQAPRFLVVAARDANGANLERIQIVKGWLDASGVSHERIYDVAVTNQAAAGGSGPVNLADATYLNSIGSPMLSTVWQDPDFDATSPAFYYVRVLEIPTPRWTAYDAVTFGIELPDEVPQVIQDRAYSSPIWYRP